MIPRWVAIWLGISVLITGWDAAFVFLRPLSLPGGSLDWLFLPYETYVEVDHGYSDLSNAFIWAQAVMTATEVCIGITALALMRRVQGWAALLALCSLTMTGAKTVLIFLVEVMSGLANVGHNPVSDLVLLYFLPNGVWVVLPCLAVISLGRTLVGRLR